MENVSKGKKLLIAAIVVSLLISFAGTALNSSLLYVSGKPNEATFKLAQGAFRFILECLLFLFIYKGHRWARIVALVLFGIGTLISLITVFASGIFMLIIAIPYSVIFIILVSKPVKDYQDYKRNGNTNNI